MTEFTPVASTVGGILIGLSAVMLMALNGRIAGLTAILASVIPPLADGWQWRFVFLAGAVIAPILYFLVIGSPVPFSVPVSLHTMAIGGFVVGIGVFYGSGCTSGHGVCGIARFSLRSITATCVFMAATFATVFVVRHLIGI
jgi:uncharacterized protein